MADMRNSTTYRNSTKWASGRFERRVVPTCSDPHDKSFAMTEDDYWIAERPRTNGGQPEDTPRRWADIQGEERRAIMPIHDAWKKGMDAPVDGTPLRSWAAMVPGLLDGLLRGGIYTVEQLAETSQAVVAGCGMGCLALQVKAQDYVKDNVADKTARAENAALKQQLEAMQAQLAQLTQLSPEERAALATKAKRPYNRKPKQEGAAHMTTGG